MSDYRDNNPSDLNQGKTPPKIPNDAWLDADAMLFCFPDGQTFEVVAFFDEDGDPVEEATEAKTFLFGSAEVGWWEVELDWSSMEDVVYH